MIEFNQIKLGNLSDADSIIISNELKYKLKSGFELELMILDKNFNPVPKYEDLINIHDKLFPECSPEMIEYVGSPGDIKDCFKQMINDLTLIAIQAESKGLRILPVDSYFGDNVPNPICLKKFKFQESILGKNNFKFATTSFGMHIHYDLSDNEEIKLNQIKYLSCLDPIFICYFSIVSSNEKFSKRIENYRKKVYKTKFFNGNLLPFEFSNMQEYDLMLQENFENFKKNSGQQFFDVISSYDKYSAVWGPIRINKKYNTIESRAMGSIPDFEYSEKILNLVFNGMIKILDGFKFDFMDSSYEKVKKLSDKATDFGLNDFEVFSYISKIFLDLGMDKEMPIPIQNILKDKINSFNNNNDKYAYLYEIFIGNLKNKFIQQIEK